MLRKEARARLDDLWRSGRMAKSEAYHWMAVALDIPEAACLFGLLTESQCQALIKAAAELDFKARTTTNSALAEQAFSDIRKLLAQKKQP